MKTGLFWSQQPHQTKPKFRSMPPIPDTGWRRPTIFPDLAAAKVIGIDTETKDKNLLEKGPGWARGDGHIIGISISTDTGFKAYYPIRHELECHDNFDPPQVFAWLQGVLGNPRQAKVGANLIYDIGWLKEEGIIVRGPLYDIQYAEALLTEGQPVNLDALAWKYLRKGKESNLLYKWCSEYYGGEATGKQRANLYRTPPRLAGRYAEEDADLPISVYLKQHPLIESEGLAQVFRMECDLIYLMIDMRIQGVTVDVARAEQLSNDLTYGIQDASKQIKNTLGFEINVDSSDDLAKAFNHQGLKYPMTKKKNPSFKKEFLEGLDHPLAQMVMRERQLRKLKGTFVDGYILDGHVNGKVHCQFNQLRNDGGGARSGRLSSSNPNLQNIPSRNKIWAPKVRGLFIPDPGHVTWRKYDYSQIEYRFLAHFAVGPGADEIRQLFINDPTTDYHQAVIDLVQKMTGQLLDRKPAKNINFGLLYGMGKSKLAKSLGLDPSSSKVLFEAYHEGVPFVKATMDAATKEVMATGIMETILGRRSRFNLWVPVEYDPNAIALPLDKALKYYGNQIKRAYGHKGINRKLQGSAADQMKMAMWKCYQDGVFDITGVPRLTVHDELNFSCFGAPLDAYKEMVHIMETVIPLKVPALVDLEVGPNWGEVVEVPRQQFAY